MKENTICILTYMLLVAAFDFMIGWVCGQQVCRRKNAEQQLAELSNNLPRACSGTKAQQRQFKELRSVLNDSSTPYSDTSLLSCLTSPSPRRI